MNPTTLHIASPDQIPATWGTPREAVRKSTVAIREPQGSETFSTAWGTLTATPGKDLIVIQDSGEQCPIKKDIFLATYEEITTGRYRKMARSRLVLVPPGVVAVLATPEGALAVSHPDYVVIGADNEVYANAAAWVAENLTFIT